MAISSSLTNALSGLTAASRAAEVVSSNVANALNESYGRRELELSSHSLAGNGAGVAVRGVVRAVDQVTINERRLADASLGMATVSAEALGAVSAAIGAPDDPGSLGGRLATLEAALVEAESRPDVGSRLAAVYDGFAGVADKLNAVSDRLQALRMEADRSIASDVDALNLGLARIAELNGEIRLQLGRGNDATALMDQRQSLIDSLSAIVPMHEVPRDNGQIALFTSGGAVLLDGAPAPIGFSAVGVIVPQMSLASGALSGLTINGQAVRTDSGGPLSGGRLAGHFAIRDDLAPGAQAELDALARDLVERLADPAVDPTIASGGSGILTDAGAAFLPANEVGLAARIAINPALDPAAGGAQWRLRDGLGAAAPGAVGDASILRAVLGALTASRPPASGGFAGVARTVSGLAAEIASQALRATSAAENDRGFSQAQQEALKEIELRSGVDTDQEMQRLLLIERAYAANARVISTVDEMIQTLIGI